MTIRESWLKTEKKILSPFAFLSKNASRPGGAELDDTRTDFQRDRDRIIHSKSFRRLKGKTQVFMSADGDHFRTRLTHTLEVSQIARTVARALRLNEDLVEAISLGHDLGHTPFGHCGETTLDAIAPFEFKHYEQSVRVVQVIEREYRGLNLTNEVADGILNHSGGATASTLEGKVVKFSDKIAYINHDIDDAVRCGILKESDIPQKFLKALGDTHSARISTMVNAIIDESRDKDDVTMQGDIYELMYGLREFMFENVYKHPFAVAEEKKAAHLVVELYEFFLNNPSDMPGEYILSVEREGLERTVCDYIAGMTDNYATIMFTDKIVPKAFYYAR